jgi:hypothetical protein
VEVHVVDTSSLVSAIRIAPPVRNPGELNNEMIRVSNLDQNTIELAWTGGQCSYLASFRVTGDKDTLGIAFDLGQPCLEQAAVDRAVVLSLVEAVDADNVVPLASPTP